MGEAAKSLGSSSQAAGGATIASLALTVASDVTQGSATQAADDFKADRAQRAAEFGQVQATLTDVTMRENLNTTLGNIETIRAAAGIDPTSPTTAALLDRSEQLSDRQRDGRRRQPARPGRGRSRQRRLSAQGRRLRGQPELPQSRNGCGGALAKAIPGMG
jgi:hypothetical protein